MNDGETRYFAAAAPTSDLAAFANDVEPLPADPVAYFLGVDQVWLIRLLGAGLLGFAMAVFAVSGTKTSVLDRWSQIISLNDLGWVAGTVVVIGLGWQRAAGQRPMVTTSA